MAYDLDRIIDRKGSGSSKWELYRGGSHAGPIIPIDSDLQSDGPIPMWVADMDFLSPSCVLNAMKNRVEHGILVTLMNQMILKKI